MSRFSSPRETRPCARGAALLELALVAPLLVAMLLFSIYLTELVRARLRLQEAGRYLAWEMTARALSDYGRGDSAAAFEAARRAAEAEAVRRYRDLDSAEEVAPRSFGVEYEDLEVKLEDQDVPLQGRANPDLEGDGGPWSDRAVTLAQRGVRASLEAWRFDTRGQVRAEVSLRLRSTILPRQLMVGGDRLAVLRLRSHLTLIADGWHLVDGADATIAGGRAGNHRSGKTESGLLRQVERMKFLGDPGFIDPEVPFLKAVRGVLPLALPDLASAFAVSHNYGPARGRGCEGLPGYPDPASRGLDARGGLSNLKGLLDYPRPMCFDTAPFRDTQRYAGSQYLRMFQARGGFFMGCRRAQADNPAAAQDPEVGDGNRQKVNCEVER